MTLEIKVSDKNTLIPLALEIYANRLYRKDGIIKHDIRRLIGEYLENRRIVNYKYSWISNKQKYSRPKEIISVAYKDGIPVGCLVIVNFQSNVYVKKEYRKQGIASKLFLETAKVYRIGQNIINFGKSAAAKKLKRRFKIPGTFREYWKLKASGKNIFDPPV